MTGTTDQSGIVTIGNFDGVHIGHKHIIEHVLQLAQTRNVPSILYTFDPHPMEILQPEQTRYRLCTKNQTMHLLQQTGLNHIIVEAFTKDFSRLSPEEFIHQRIVHLLQPAVIIVGENFRFGTGGTGGRQLLTKLGKKYHFEVKIMPHLKKDGCVISSSLIRRSILDGKWDTVSTLLGRPFSIKAPVVKGANRGKSLGFPTINLKPNSQQLLPANGVYIAQIANSRQPAAVNIGFCPTFSTNTTRKIEIHIIEKNIKWQDSECEVEILRYIRPEQSFSNVTALTRQIQQDIKQVQQYFSQTDQ